MKTSELITPQHQALKAIIYIRQSTPNQAISNQESLKLQYALKQRAIELGWPSCRVQIIDNDLGQTGAEAEHRKGFKDLLAQVALGQIGIILSFDVTRLSRNCSDWYPLLDICGYRQCLIGDRDSIYDPGTTNGRLLLGLKGQLAEMELSTIRARLTAGILNKAQRGELALQLPVGLLRDAIGYVRPDPNHEVSDRIKLIFDTFLKVTTISKVLRYMNQHNLLIPKYDRFHDLHWKKPTIASLAIKLKNPAYAGAFAYGKTRIVRNGPNVTDKKIVRLPQNEWKILIKDKYSGYISWEIFERIQEMLKQNYAEYERNKTRGIPRAGAALLHGLVYCGECGHKMLVQYKSGTRYLCNALRQQYQTPVCQFLPADPVDEFVVNAFFQAIAPTDLNAYENAIKDKSTEKQAINKSYKQEIERLSYQEKLAQRQFNQVDPDNRLVASELEKRWEASLRELKAAEEKLDATPQFINEIPPLSPELKNAFLDIGKKLPTIWDSGQLNRVRKKQFLRCLIDKVVVHRDARDKLLLRIVWKGGDTTTTHIPIKVGSFLELSSAKEMETIMLEMSQSGKKDEEIAAHLTKLGYRSPMKEQVIASTVKTIRLKNRVLQKEHQSHPLNISGHLSVSQIAKKIDVTVHWVYDRIHNKRIKVNKDVNSGSYLFPDKYETIKMFKQLKNNLIYDLDFREGHQDV